jgi:hypothetical protein
MSYLYPACCSFKSTRKSLIKAHSAIVRPGSSVDDDANPRARIPSFWPGGDAHSPRLRRSKIRLSPGGSASPWTRPGVTRSDLNVVRRPGPAPGNGLLRPLCYRRTPGKHTRVSSRISRPFMKGAGDVSRPHDASDSHLSHVAAVPSPGHHSLAAAGQGCPRRCTSLAVRFIFRRAPPASSPFWRSARRQTGTDLGLQMAAGRLKTQNYYRRSGTCKAAPGKWRRMAGLVKKNSAATTTARARMEDSGEGLPNSNPTRE